MPSRPMRPCSRHGGVLVGAGQPCPKCMGEPVLQSILVAQADTKPSAYRRGYGRKHAEKRRELLRRSPYCVDPYNRHPTIRKPATIRDHKVPLAAGGTDDTDNEQGLCQSCHNYKMYRDGSRNRRGQKKFERGSGDCAGAVEKSFLNNAKKSGN
jgi:5-methylcytosine-specific restriction endonuclease McrA